MCFKKSEPLEEKIQMSRMQSHSFIEHAGSIGEVLCEDHEGKDGAVETISKIWPSMSFFSEVKK